jgi:hypothetical protein
MTSLPHTLADIEALTALRAGLLIVWGAGGLLALRQVKQAHEWGLAWLAFGCYVALGWLALKP